jgi:hypothetical protein
LVATKRIFTLLTASQIASASAASFFCRLRVSRDREHGFHCIVSKYFAGS